MAMNVTYSVFQVIQTYTTATIISLILLAVVVVENNTKQGKYE